MVWFTDLKIHRLSRAWRRWARSSRLLGLEALFSGRYWITLTITLMAFSRIYSQPVAPQHPQLAGNDPAKPGLGTADAEILSVSNFAARAKQVFFETRSKMDKQPANPEAAWQFAQACFDWAEFATNNAQRAEIAEQGIAAARQAVAGNSRSAPAHYYLGMNLGQLARTKSLGALKLVSQMEHEFGLARDLDEKFDHAGPDRNLGLLYRDAPALGSIGSRTKARQHLQRAAELAPDFPENRLNLIESNLKWGERGGATNQLNALEAIWPAARTNLVGAAWAPSWADWQTRLNQVKKKLEKAAPAPRGRP
jgi:hypothetical protein